jgi:hypothetical protein
MPASLETITSEMHQARARIWGVMSATTSAMLAFPFAAKGAEKVCHFFNLQLDITKQYSSFADTVHAIIQPIGLTFAGVTFAEEAIVLGAGYFAGKTLYKLFKRPTIRNY